MLTLPIDRCAASLMIAESMLLRQAIVGLLIAAHDWLFLHQALCAIDKHGIIVEPELCGFSCGMSAVGASRYRGLSNGLLGFAQSVAGRCRSTRLDSSLQEYTRCYGSGFGGNVCGR